MEGENLAALIDRQRPSVRRALEIVSINLDALWATEAELRYNARNGDLLISANGYLSGVVLRASDDVIFENVEIPWATDNFYTELHPAAIFAVGLMEPGQYELGSVLSPGLSRQQFSESFSEANFLAGVGRTDFTIASGGAVQFALVHVPEPDGCQPVLLLAVIMWTMVRPKRPKA